MALIPLLFLLLPTYLIRFNIGPLPTTLLEVIVWIILFVYLLKALKHKNIKTLTGRLSSIAYRHISLCIAIILFLGSATYSAFITSINRRAALGEWKAFYIEPFLIFLVLITTIKQQDANSKIQILKTRKLKTENFILFALILCGFATSLLAIYQHFTGFLVPYAFWDNMNTHRVTGWYGFPNAVGLFLAPLIPLALYLVKQSWSVIARSRDDKTISQSDEIASLHCGSTSNNRLMQWRILISSFLFLISAPLAVIFAKSTGGLIGITAGIGALLLMNKKTRIPSIITACSLLVVLCALPNTNSIKQELFMQDRSGQIRINMWGEAIELLKTRPIKGVGLASYQQLIVPYHHQVNGDNIEIFHHEHNIFLTMWVNLGLFGLIGFLWMIVWFYRVGIMEIMRNWKLETGKELKKQSLISHFQFQISSTPFLLASMTTLVVTGLVDSPYIKNDLSLFFWLLLGLMTISTQSQHITSTICQNDENLAMK